MLNRCDLKFSVECLGEEEYPSILQISRKIIMFLKVPYKLSVRVVNNFGNIEHTKKIQIRFFVHYF